MVKTIPVDPEIQAMIDALPYELGTFKTVEEIIEQRALGANIYPTFAVPNGVDHVIDEYAGIVVRVIKREESPAARPCIFWMHGGGYMAGSRYLDDKLLDRWSAALNCVGVSVEYRFAPEHPYPTPIEDCYTGFKWMLDNAAKLGIDTSRIVIGGISAGGGLAASLALMARDRGAPSLAGQVLISPMIDDRQSNESNSWDVPIWPPLANRIGWSAYFPQGGAPEYASPARVEDLANLARAYVMVGSAEVFLDESIAYARRLIGAGNMAELQVCGGAPHGFETLALGAATTIRAFGALDAWLSTILKTPLKS